MKKVLTPLVLMAFAIAPVFAQHSKIPPTTIPPANPSNPQLHWDSKAAAPPATNPFGVATARPKPMPVLQPSNLSEHADVSITRGENGLPIFLKAKPRLPEVQQKANPLVSVRWTIASACIRKASTKQRLSLYCNQPKRMSKAMITCV